MKPTQVIHLTFHGVGDPPRVLDPGEATVWLSRASFESFLELVAERPDVNLTFDDGNESDVTIALPALVARSRTASFFIPAAVVGCPGFVDEDGMRALTSAGMVVGSHGMRHRSWVGLPPDAAREEIVEARDRIAAIVGRPVEEAACPFGAYDRRALRLLRDAGYRRVYTSDRGPALRDDWLQPRNTVHRDDRLDHVRGMIEPSRNRLGAAVRVARLAVKRWR
jgi:peptidoglycan/xylan/chitin deacetylase (PgdA/CDA1 family)